MNTQTHKVFLVDDHPLFRQGLANLIDRRPGFHVCGHAESASEAIEMMKEMKPDIALVDLTLKSGHGLELIAQIRQELPETASVVLSMHDERHFAERSIRAGALGYVMKSESPDVVLQALDHAVRRESFLSAQMRALAVERFVKGMPSTPGSPEEILSARELEIFQLLGKGKDTRQIASELGLSIKTVQTFCAKIKDKLHIKTSTALMREAVQWVDSLALS